MTGKTKGFLNAALALEDGSVWKGRGFGKPGALVTGEVVFNTGMMGYTQSVTDPSYTGQILCQTYPLVGNYGVCREEFESPSPKITGYVVAEACERPSHHTSEMSLHEWLRAAGVPGIQGIDTRELTKILRMRGTMLGALQVSENGIDEGKLLAAAKGAQDPSGRDLVSEVTIKVPITYSSSGSGVGPKVVVIDCGMKEGIAQSLLSRGMDVTRVPASYKADAIMKLSPRGVVVSNGPGDPKKAGYVAKTISSLLEYRVPIMGICLGNQLLGRALGCDTYKLKFGHRGQNHPVMDKATGMCYITSQNHGFAISPDSVDDKDVRVSFVNVNDGTVEGIEHRKLPAFAVQFHPEARPGPVDTGFLFDKFARMMEREKQGNAFPAFPLRNRGGKHAKG
ncbi:MAG: glutamine-hydrolyzing carbamoyl-phosphate synthase small subunit [Candidatus Aenigmatarchaeota archaeon]